MKFDPVTLEGQYVRLEPLGTQHKAGLCAAIAEGDSWKIHVTSVPHPDDIDTYLAAAAQAYEAGDGLAFATIDKLTDRVAGSTRFMHAVPAHKSVEIGTTFVGIRWRKSRVNTEAKLLMLSHAFDVLGTNRVEFLTDYLNTTSRNAILRLGAKQEGILRNHKVTPSGRIRDSVIFSIIRNEWPGVKEHLQHKLA